jgi:hypothetical protein
LSEEVITIKNTKAQNVAMNIMWLMNKISDLLLDFLHFSRVLSRRTAELEDNIVTQVLVNCVEKWSRQQEIADEEPSVVDQNVLQQEVDFAAHGEVRQSIWCTPVCHTRARTVARSAPASRRTRKNEIPPPLSQQPEAFAEIKMKNADKKNKRSSQANASTA